MADQVISNKENIKPTSEMAVDSTQLYDKAMSLEIIKLLSTAPVDTSMEILTNLISNQTHSAPTPTDILSACALNPLCGPQLLTHILTPSTASYTEFTTNYTKFTTPLPKLFSTAARNSKLYAECIDVFLQHSPAVIVDRALVSVLAEKGVGGKNCLRKIFREGKGVVCDEWEKGDVVDVVRGRFGHVVLGEMVGILGVVHWQSLNDQRYCGLC